MKFIIKYFCYSIHGIEVSAKKKKKQMFNSFVNYFYHYILDDTVYLSDEVRRQEYILNDIGKIYIGSHSKPKGRQWVYGQVNENESNIEMNK